MVTASSKEKPQPRYIEKMVDAFNQGKIPRGAVHEVDVLHDDDCLIFATGVCTCDPDIVVK